MRPVPRVTTAWQVPGSKKIYGTKAQAYYALAKELTLQKFPPWLTGVDWRHGTSLNNQLLELLERTLRASPPILTVAQAIAREDKALKLFFTNNQFDSQKWVQFVRRVAKYLRWVDERRGDDAEAQATEDEQLEAQFQYCENQATQWMTRAEYYRREAERRGQR